MATTVFTVKDYSTRALEKSETSVPPAVPDEELKKAAQEIDAANPSASS
jgi:hypothetical protein